MKVLLSFLKFLYLAPLYAFFATAALTGSVIIGIGLGAMTWLGDITFTVNFKDFMGF